MKKLNFVLVLGLGLIFSNVYSQNLGGILNDAAGMASKAGGNAGTAGDITEENGNVHVEGVGYKKTFSLSGGTLRVDGTSNVITINGFASKIIVEGAGNTVYVDKVNNVLISGSSSKVYYRTTDNKSKRPDAKVEGPGAGVIKQK
ncbi:DUF3060 domain-containing protein [Soonwooa sp.]|uniref:DUF3060 domain-containing protein n=1 Tax=Soonwooa sp. TaxID=1938592 RepID=UPI002613F142|nr:DUF3060 domain-containing protein [Soonwooa sp.]